MWNKLDERKRRIVAIATMVVILYVAYRFSFSHAIGAYRLSKSLKKEAELQLENAAYPHLNKKYLFYQQVLNGYKVKKEEMDTKIWQVVSEMAVAQQVKVSYSPTTTPPLDTMNRHNVFEQQFGFKGKYFDLVKLLDSLSQSAKIGKVSQITIAVPKAIQPAKEKNLLEMKLSLSSLE